MRDLSVQASNTGSLNDSAKANIQKEMGQLKEELTRISTTTNFNGTKLLDGSYNGSFQVGANAGESIAVEDRCSGKGMDAAGLNVAGVDVTGVGKYTSAAASAAGTVVVTSAPALRPPRPSYDNEGTAGTTTSPAPAAPDGLRRT